MCFRVMFARGRLRSTFGRLSVLSKSRGAIGLARRICDYATLLFAGRVPTISAVKAVSFRFFKASCVGLAAVQQTQCIRAVTTNGVFPVRALADTAGGFGPIDGPVRSSD